MLGGRDAIVIANEELSLIRAYYFATGTVTGAGPHVQPILDSDDGLIVSWSEADPVRLPAEHLPRGAGDLKSLGKWYNSRRFDPLKRQLFWHPVRWHAGPVTDAHLRAEAQLLDELGAALAYDWRAGVFRNAAGEPIGDLNETREQYNARV